MINLCLRISVEVECETHDRKQVISALGLFCFKPFRYIPTEFKFYLDLLHFVDFANFSYQFIWNDNCIAALFFVSFFNRVVVC